MGSSKDIAAGLLFMLIGLGFAVTALVKLRLGTALSMGPGYFPVILGTLLAALGLAIALAGLRKAPEPLGRMPWARALPVLGAIVLFGTTVRGLGFAPALMMTALVAAKAGGMTWRGALLTAALLTLFCTLIFVEALGLPYPTLGRWLRA